MSTPNARIKKLFATTVVLVGLGGAATACGSANAASPSASASDPIAASAPAADDTSGEATFCQDLQTLDTDYYNFIQSNGQDPTLDQLGQDGSTIGSDSVSTPWSDATITAGHDLLTGKLDRISAGLNLLDGNCEAAGYSINDQVPDLIASQG